MPVVTRRACTRTYGDAAEPASVWDSGMGGVGRGASRRLEGVCERSPSGSSGVPPRADALPVALRGLVARSRRCVDTVVEFGGADRAGCAGASRQRETRPRSRGGCRASASGAHLSRRGIGASRRRSPRRGPDGRGRRRCRSFFPLAMRILSLLTLLALVPAASAQVREGQLELAGSASFSSTEGTTVFQLAPTVGYFFTDAFEGGVELNYTSIENGGDSGTVGPFLAYHFGDRRAKARPFLQAQIATSFTDDTDVVFGGAGGVKYFFLPGGALRGQVFVLTSGDVTQVGVSGGVAIFL